MEDLDTFEYDIAEWILQHKDGLNDQIKSLYRPNYHLFPSTLLGLYLDHYQEGALSIIRNVASSALNLNPEQTLTITARMISRVSPDLLTPPRKGA